MSKEIKQRELAGQSNSSLSRKDCRDMSVYAAGAALQRGRGGCSALAHITQWEVQMLSAKKSIKTGFFCFFREDPLSAASHTS